MEVGKGDVNSFKARYTRIKLDAPGMSVAEKQAMHTDLENKMYWMGSAQEELERGVNPITKTCPVCDESRPLDEFSRSINGRYGRHTYCRTCRREMANVGNGDGRLGGKQQVLASTGVKECTKCGLVKTLDRFHVDRRKAGGRTSHCKDCRRA